MKKVLITGGTGFIGNKLTRLLQLKGYKVILLSRHKPKDPKLLHIKADLAKEIPYDPLLEGLYGVIHLAGKNIIGRWTSSFKKGVYNSRIEGTKNLVNAFQKVKKKPKVFISASAIGYYGNRKNDLLTENDGPGKDFLAHVCTDWEKESAKTIPMGMRWAAVRTALVIGSHGGIIQTLKPLFKWFAGGPLGTGKQYFPWVHINDLARAYLFILENRIDGPINVCAPEKITNEEFSAAFAKKLHRPSWLRTRKWMLRIIFGDFTNAIMASQRVSSKKLESADFVFEYPTIEKALTEAV
mgnify:CR=1 FL=1